MANLNVLSVVMRSLLGEQRADSLRINRAVLPTPPQFLNTQSVKLTCRCDNGKSVLFSADSFVVSLPQRKFNYSITKI